MNILYIFFLVVTAFAVQECHDLTLQEYRKVLVLHNATYMIELFRGDCKYEQLTNPISTQQVLNYEPDTLDVDLYGIYNIKNNTVVALSLNKTQLSNVLETNNDFDKENYSVEPVNNTMIFKGDDRIKLVSEKSKRDWSTVQYFVLSNVAVGATLKVAATCTESDVVQAVYDGYVALNAAPGRYLADLKNALTSSVYWEASIQGARGYFSNSAESNGETMQGLIADIGSRVKRITPYDKFFKAPAIKSDTCKSQVNDLGWSDWSQLDLWGQWYADHLLNGWWHAGSCANHIYWDIGGQSFWVQSVMIRPNTKDGEVTYQGCDDGDWDD